MTYKTNMFEAFLIRLANLSHKLLYIGPRIMGILFKLCYAGHRFDPLG